MEKAGIPVLLNTEATPELIGQGGYDAVFAATGAAPKLPDIPGVDGANVHTHLSVYGNEEKLGHKVVSSAALRARWRRRSIWPSADTT